MNREDLVTVKVKSGEPVALSHGRFSLVLGAGESADKWLDGSPITRAEFEILLGPLGIFELAGEVKLSEPDETATANREIGVPVKQQEE
jgi:hypothetical protein